MEYETISEEKYNKRAKYLGNVYAIITSKGYALGQVADIEKTEGFYICRIFTKLYKDIPTNIEEIIAKKEDFIVQSFLPSMTRTRIKTAIKVGKYEIPKTYSTPIYTKVNTCFRGALGPMRYWHIVPNYLPLIEAIDTDKWVTEVLHKNIYDSSWKEDYKKLNSGALFWDDGLIEWLEKGYNLDNWLPSDFNKSVNYLWHDYFTNNS